MSRAALSVFAHVTPKSANEKTGPIPVTTTSADTCPPACPFRKRVERGGKRSLFGCYADGGPLAIHWEAVTDGERGELWPQFLRTLERVLIKRGPRTLWRHNQAGDLVGHGNTIDAEALDALVAVNAAADARGFTYTHKPVIAADARGLAALADRNLAAVRDANARGFTVNLSANGLAHADDLIERAGVGVPVTAVVPHDMAASGTTPRGRRFVVCPAQTRDGVTCQTCRLCSRSDRTVVVAFRAHGQSFKRAERSLA